MTPAQRALLWTDLATEAAQLARDYAATFAVGAARAPPSLIIRMAAARGLSRGLDFRALPHRAWEDGREFLWLLSGLLDAEAAPVARLASGSDLVVSSGRLIAVLTAPVGRPRADLEG